MRLSSTITSARPAAVLKKLLRAPFFHFIVLGALIFLLYAFVRVPDLNLQDRQILITDDRVEQLQSRFRQVWKRDPTPKETEGLVEEFIREEILYREALALGLDQDDQAIRNRLRYKLEFLADSGAQLLDPGDEELLAFAGEHAERYSIPPKMSFLQIYLGEKPTVQDIEQTQLAARDLDKGSDFLVLGERSMLPAEMREARPEEIDRVFGTGFAEELSQQPLEAWEGPVASSFGLHLVWLKAKEPGRNPDLAEIRPAVLRDWQSDTAQEIRELQLERFRERYEIIREGSGSP